MLPNSNRQVLLKSRPAGIPQAENFEIAEGPAPQIGDRQFLVRNEFLSVEPAMRGWVSAVANYSTPVGIGEVMRSFAAGTVMASKHPGFAEGDRVMGMLGWQQYAVSDGANITRKVKETDLPLSLSLGVLGLNGVTAYFGLLDLGEPKPGDTVVVSTAAGAVGSAVGQIARLSGCRTVGITGGAVKGQLCRDEFGYDDVIDYKAGDVSAALKAACAKGVDVYFDNTAGANQRCRLCAACASRARRRLRHRLRFKLGPMAARPPPRAAYSGEARARQRTADFRLRAPL